MSDDAQKIVQLIIPIPMQRKQEIIVHYHNETVK